MNNDQLTELGRQLGVGGGLTIVDEPVVSEPYAVAVSGDSPRLLRAVDETLAEMEADGTTDALVSKWLAGGQ